MSIFKTSAIILAGGTGSRMMSDKTKQLIDICGMTVLERTALAFAKSDMIDEIVVVARAEELEYVNSLLGLHKFAKPIKVTVGGA